MKIGEKIIDLETGYAGEIIEVDADPTAALQIKVYVPENAERVNQAGEGCPAEYWVKADEICTQKAAGSLA